MIDAGTPSPLLSIRDIAPLETGGQRARQGFGFQDHVTAGFCLDMLSERSLVEVWCEAHDDITLLWEVPELQAEFVQVKSDEPDHLWSVSRVCRRDQGRVGTSIFERSLANDRELREQCRFRLVFSQGVNAALRPFRAHDATTDARRRAVDRLLAVWPAALRSVRSPAQHDADHWLTNLHIDVISSDQIASANLLKLSDFAATAGIALLPDQVRECYRRLLRLVVDSATRERMDANPERITRPQVIQFLDGVCRAASVAASLPPSAKLREKLEAAGISQETIQTAEVLRRGYRRMTLDPGFLDFGDRESIDLQILSKLLELRDDLDLGIITEDGATFHRHCRVEMDALSSGRGNGPSHEYYFGAMYEQTERCVHRFVSASA